MQRRFTLTRSTGTVLAALALGACSSSGSDPWVGAYVGTTVTMGVDCATGVAQTPATRSVTTNIMRDSSDTLFVASSTCPIYLDALSDSYATVRVRSCSAALPDGTPVEYSFTSGTVRHTGDTLHIEYDARAMTATQCADAHTVFDGSRL